jgi:hypothetical protein
VTYIYIINMFSINEHVCEGEFQRHLVQVCTLRRTFLPESKWACAKKS